MGTCRLLLFGPPQIQREGQAVSIRLRKALALAAYLAVERRAFTREYLATLLWPSLGQQSAHANLRRMISYLRDTLGRCGIKTDGDLVQFEASSVGVDLVEFESLGATSPSDSGIGPLEAAAALYRGRFLEGFVLGDCLEFDEWQDGVRRRMEERFDKLLETLCLACLRVGQTRAALEAARKRIELDPLNEPAHRFLMETCLRVGRADLARKQFETCSRILAREGLEPEEQTRDLNKAINGHRHDANAGSPAMASEESGRRRPHRRFIQVAGAILAIAAIFPVGFLVTRIVVGRDLSVPVVKTFLEGDELSRLEITLKSTGILMRRVRFSIVFSSDQRVVAPRDYLVYSGVTPMRFDSKKKIEVDGVNDIRAYIREHSLAIPPGMYSIAVIVDPDGMIAEGSELDNRATGSTRFFFPGTAPESAFTIDVTYRGSGALSEENPLNLYLGDGSLSVFQFDSWARFAVTRDGRYFLPVVDLPQHDTDGSGYILIAMYDSGGDLKIFNDPGLGDIGAIYQGDAKGLSYGVFNVASGTAITPGRNYRIDFSPPAPPPADAFEVDDGKEIGTVIEYGALPVRQHHTFHDEGTGDIDQDWFRIAVKAGDTLTVETYSAGGVWECDTAIDTSDFRGYLWTGDNKTEQDLYSIARYVNETGVDQVCCVLVKPKHMRYAPGVNRYADYFVEFRR